MNTNRYPFYFITAGLVSLLLGLLCGLLAGFQYVVPDFIKETLPFTALRPLHTLFVVSWVLLTATGGIYYYLSQNHNERLSNSFLVQIHFWIFILTGFGIAVSYLFRNFAGKEYLEFPSYYYFPIVLGWLLFGITYFKTLAATFKSWPVYYWMWATGIGMMMYHFTEAHLWLLPYFKSHFIQNTALQWKAGGSYVGSWNMLVYGTAVYIMAKMSGDDGYAKSGKAFFFYFLGLTNLMFGWAHHVYIVPTAPWIRYLAYGISMTEWIILASMIYDWKNNLTQDQKTAFPIAHQFMRLADFWVFLNIILALLISIPAINLFTHGTHITVAHSMGTTIGINTMILLSSVTYIIESNQCSFSGSKIRFGMRLFQTSFVLFWCCLLLMGVQKVHWTFFDKTLSFSQFQEAMHGFYLVFVLFGLRIFIGLYRIVFELLNGLRLSLK
ncbi:cbb3-type cytochrome c oxidase subunit I [Flavobacterium sedimenticola]|uniref:Cbb3-type cytochrome c oxidase subunit I n=1 Tax=Flavobacterium sedimenticola TaxID=3043286 RepID=A0ABT6XMD2_9FLAO|nr:cbb3-type cytochrome c oxidase subunit I [Flavobacterium sedimenticola]MDI9256244.1 cbb3-type cytochrome c oxidase subunit I [Flavobacterium sedimenticola]